MAEPLEESWLYYRRCSLSLGSSSRSSSDTSDFGQQRRRFFRLWEDGHMEWARSPEEASSGTWLPVCASQAMHGLPRRLLRRHIAALKQDVRLDSVQLDKHERVAHHLVRSIKEKRLACVILKPSGLRAIPSSPKATHASNRWGKFNNPSDTSGALFGPDEIVPAMLLEFSSAEACSRWVEAMESILITTKARQTQRQPDYGHIEEATFSNDGRSRHDQGEIETNVPILATPSYLESPTNKADFLSGAVHVPNLPRLSSVRQERVWQQQQQQQQQPICTTAWTIETPHEKIIDKLLHQTDSTYRETRSQSEDLRLRLQPRKGTARGVYQAAFRGDVVGLICLILGGQSVFYRDSKGRNIAHAAVMAGRVGEPVLAFISEFAFELLQTPDKLGNTPLHVAVSKSMFEISKLMLESAVTPTLANAQGWTALGLASSDDRPLKRLLYKYKDSKGISNAENEADAKQDIAAMERILEVWGTFFANAARTAPSFHQHENFPQSTYDSTTSTESAQVQNEAWAIEPVNGEWTARQHDFLHLVPSERTDISELVYVSDEVDSCQPSGELKTLEREQGTWQLYQDPNCLAWYWYNEVTGESKWDE